MAQVKADAPKLKKRKLKGARAVRRAVMAHEPPTPFAQRLHQARQNVEELKTRHALVALDQRYRGVYGSDRERIMKQMRDEIDRTLGEAVGTRLPIERPLYPEPRP